MLFTLSGNGGPTGADHGGFFPSTAFGRLTSHLLRLARLHDQHRGRRPVTAGRVQRVPGLPRPDPAPLGRLQLGIFLPDGGKRLYFANEYIQFPNCTGKTFTLTHRDLRRDPRRLRQLGNLGQLRRAVVACPPAGALG